jgi:hypothetical protein
MANYSRTKVLASDKKYTGSTETKPRRLTEAAIYTGRQRPNMHADPGQQRPQDAIDQRAKNYDNDLPLKGDRAWLRGGADGGCSRPTFDHSNGRGTQPAKGLKASGADATKSPFSAAHRKGAGEGF